MLIKLPMCDKNQIAIIIVVNIIIAISVILISNFLTGNQG